MKKLFKIAGLVFIIGLVGCSDEAEDSFFNKCENNGLAKGFCSCIWKDMNKKYNHEEIKIYFEHQYAVPVNFDNEIKNSIIACRKEY